MSHQDNTKNRRTPLHYMVALERLDAVEFFLTIGTNTGTRRKEGKKAKKIYPLIYPFDPTNLGLCITLRFIFKTLLQYTAYTYDKSRVCPAATGSIVK